MAKQAKSAKVVASSGNVFADLGLPDAAELDTKVRLAVAVNRLLESRRLTPINGRLNQQYRREAAVH